MPSLAPRESRLVQLVSEGRIDGWCAHHIPERSFAMRDAEADYTSKFGEGQSLPMLSSIYKSIRRNRPSEIFGPIDEL